MSPSYGLVGLPNAGKSTLFNALTEANAEVGCFPFTTVSPNKGVAVVRDRRADFIAELLKSDKVTYSALEVIDIAGLVRGANRGEGLGNQFLAHIREVDAIFHVVRCFEGPEVSHVEGPLDPVRDAEIVNTELILADMEFLGRRIERTKKLEKSLPKRDKTELEMLERLLDHLSRGYPARTAPEVVADHDIASSLLTTKPVVYIANVSEALLVNPEKNRDVESLSQYCRSHLAPLVLSCAKLERELVELEGEDRREFMTEWGLRESSLDVILREGLKVLELVTFFTGNRRETRAWLVKNGTNARQAAGKVHTDMERGFIAAEVISCEELMAMGSLTTAREAGKVRLEGAGYRVSEGDLIQFRFSPS